MFRKILISLVVCVLGISAFNMVIANNPLNPDDGDIDSDGDGLSNIEEYNYGTDPNNADSDNDGIPDGWEAFNGMDPSNPLDAHEDLDYMESLDGISGEIEAEFSAIGHSHDVWPSDGVTKYNADLHYDNYEEYYRMTEWTIDKYGKMVKTSLHSVSTDPWEANTDGDDYLDPDDLTPTIFSNDGIIYPQQPDLPTGEYAEKINDPLVMDNNQKLNVQEVIATLHSNDNVLIETDIFAALKF